MIILALFNDNIIKFSIYISIAKSSLLDHHGGYQMRNSSFTSKEKSGWKFGGEKTATVRAGTGGAQETDPLIRRGSDSSNLRERRSSRSPLTVSLVNQRFGGPSGENQNYKSTTMNTSSAANPASTISNSNSNNHTPSNNEPTTSYTKLNEDGSRLAVNASNSYNNSTVGGSRSVHSLRRSHILSGREETGTEDQGNAAQLLEIPEEIYRVRRSALQVLKPLIRTWVSIYF